MDLRAFFQKMRKIEQGITEEHVVIVSEETSDGGKAGLKSEVSRATAAKMIAEGRARLATKEEAAQFYKTMAEGRHAAEQAQMATRVQVNVISEGDMRALRGGGKAEKQ
jgi:hypothetical protein